MRRGFFALLVVFGACNFSATLDGPDAPPPDVPIDTPPLTPRVSGARAYWRFDEGAGSSIIDKAIPPPGFGPMHLTVELTSAVTWLVGGLRVNSRVTIDTSVTPHIGRLVNMSGEFSIEAWVATASLTQGLDPPDGSAPDHGTIFNVSGSIVSFSALIGQVGDHWVARARTSNTGTDGMPEIASAPGTAVVGKPTHLVLVANSTTRILYVDGVPYTSTPSGVGPLSWDEAYAVRMCDAINYDRQWEGTIYLGAMYDRALSAAEVMQNFKAHHDCPDC